MDSLVSIDDILSRRDQILVVTTRLGLDYKSITMKITSNLNAYKLTDIIALLLAHDKQFEQYNIHASSVIPTTNVSYQNLQNKFSHPTQGNSSQNLGSLHGHSSTQFHGSRGAKGREYGGISNTKPQCQLCGKMGHTVLKCYHHFDPFFTGCCDTMKKKRVVERKKGFLFCFPHISLFRTKTFIHALVTLFERVFLCLNKCIKCDYIVKRDTSPPSILYCLFIFQLYPYPSCPPPSASFITKPASSSTPSLISYPFFHLTHVYVTHVFMALHSLHQSLKFLPTHKPHAYDRHVASSFPSNC